MNSSVRLSGIQTGFVSSEPPPVIDVTRPLASVTTASVLVDTLPRLSSPNVKIDPPLT
jgi:hypothetical protein